MKRAVHFGAGNIGRGFLGQLYFESGYATTFVDVIESVVDALNARGEYPVRIVEEQTETIVVHNVGAVNSRDPEAVANVIAASDIASTAVGVNVLPRIAPALAAGLAKRFTDPNAAPLDIIVCENLIDAGPFLREQVREHLAPEFHAALDAKTGFVEASIGRMVPVMTEEQRAEDLLLVCVEPYCELPVDANGFRGPIPAIAHLKPMANFKAYVERKLFVHNLTHAATAYLGFLRGHDYIWQAIRDAKVREAVEAAGAESCEGMARKHGLDRGELLAHRDDLVRRYHNRALGDQIARVGRDPIRKLGPNDRLIGGAKMCLEQGVTPGTIALAIAAALRYNAPDDPAAQQIQQLCAKYGIKAVLREVCELPTDSELTRLTGEAAQRLLAEGWLK